MLFIDKNHAIKAYYCENRTKNKNKKGSLRGFLLWIIRKQKIF